MVSGSPLPSMRSEPPLFIHNRGFATVNDGPVFSSQLARHLNTLIESGLPHGAGIAQPGVVTGASLERPTGRTSEAPTIGSGKPFRVRREGAVSCSVYRTCNAPIAFVQESADLADGDRTLTQGSIQWSSPAEG